MWEPLMAHTDARFARVGRRASARVLACSCFLSVRRTPCQHRAERIEHDLTPTERRLIDSAVREARATLI